MLELKSDLKPRQMIGLNDRTRLIVYLAFQRRFRQELINGKIEEECLLISQNLVKKFK